MSHNLLQSCVLVIVCMYHQNMMLSGAQKESSQMMTTGGVYHQMPQSAPVLQSSGPVSSQFALGGMTGGMGSPRQVHLPAYSYVPQAMPSFGASAFNQQLSSSATLVGTSHPGNILNAPPGGSFGSQTESFAFNQNDFVQQVVTMSAIKEMQHEEDEPISPESNDNLLAANTSASITIQSHLAGPVREGLQTLNESIHSEGVSIGAEAGILGGRSSELSAVRQAAGWESVGCDNSENNASHLNNKNISDAEVLNANKAANIITDSAVGTHEHSPNHTPRNNKHISGFNSDDEEKQIASGARRLGCFGGLCGTGSSKRQPEPAHRF